MAIQGDKIMNLEDGQVLYNDLRRRVEKNAGVIEEVINTPSAVQSFSDGADNLPMALTVGIEPVQDLYGYDYPWPAGGGKNIWDRETYALKSGYYIRYATGAELGGNNDYKATRDYIPLPGGHEGETLYSNFTVGGSSPGMAFYDANKEYISGSKQFPATVPEGAKYIRFTINATDASNNLIVTFSSDTSYAPYENICPISGWTGANVTRTGKNLIPDGTDTEKGYKDYKYLSTTAEETTSTNFCISEYFRVKPNTVYAYSVDVSASSPSICFYDENKNFISPGYNFGGNTSIVVTSPANAVYARASKYKAGSSAGTKTQLEEGSSATAYESYARTVYDIDFPSSAGTVYGGELTINKDGSGELVVGRAEYDMGNNDWGLSSNNDAFISSYRPSGDIIPASQTTFPEVICEVYKPSPITEQADMSIAIAPSGKFKVMDSRFSQPLDATAFKTAMNGVKAVYKLATPITYSLTPGQVKTLLGVNNIWADTGDILSVDYPADTKLYIDKKFAELSAAITALGT